MFRSTLPYTIGYLLLFVLMAVLLAVFPKGELHILLNSWHTPGGDLFFRYYTLLAQWPLYVAGLLPLLLHKKWWVAFYAASEGVAAIVVTVLKHIFRMPRPLKFFDGDIASHLPIVEGVRLHHNLSFPSGHTSTFFVFATVCIILLALHSSAGGGKARWSDKVIGIVQPVILLLAALGGYSRIYLSQHFLLDVFAGSVIGITIPFMLYPLFAARLKP